MRLLLVVVEEGSLPVYTDGFPAYDSLDNDENVQREAVIPDEGEYVDGDVHVMVRCILRLFVSGLGLLILGTAIG